MSPLGQPPTREPFPVLTGSGILLRLSPLGKRVVYGSYKRFYNFFCIHFKNYYFMALLKSNFYLFIGEICNNCLLHPIELISDAIIFVYHNGQVDPVGMGDFLRGSSVLHMRTAA